MPSTQIKDTTPGRLASSSSESAHERRWSASDMLFRRWSTKRKNRTEGDDQSASQRNQRPLVLVRRHTNSAAKAPSAAQPPASPGASHQRSKRRQRSAHQQPRRDSSHVQAHKPDRIHVDQNDSSDTPARKPKKENPSLAPARPHSATHSVQAPRFLRILLNGDDDRNKSKRGKHKHSKHTAKKSSSQHSHPKSQENSSKQPTSSVTKSRHKHKHHHHRSDENHHHRTSSSSQRSKKTSSSNKTSSSKAPPKGAALGMEKIKATSTKEPTIRFSEPPVQPSSAPIQASSGALLPQVVMPQGNKDVITMPTPEHYTMSQLGDITVRKALPRVPDRRLSRPGVDSQNAESRPVTLLQPLPQRYYVNSNHPNRLSTVSQSSAATTGSKSHVSYSENADNDERQQQSVRVYRVLGRRNTNQQDVADIQAVDAQSPLLVTIAQDGSIVGESGARSTAKMPSAFSPMSSLQHQHADTCGSVSSPVTSITSTGVSTSFGTDSYKSARMFMGEEHSKEPYRRHSSTRVEFDLPSEATTGIIHDAQTPEDGDGVDYRSSNNIDDSKRRLARRGSDVSDIAMRTHLSVGEEHVDHASISDVSEGQVDNRRRNSLHSSAGEQEADQSFSEWLHLHAVTDQMPSHELRRQSLSLSQAFARTSLTDQRLHQYIPPPSLQRRYNSATSFDPQRPAHSTDDSSKPGGLVSQLLARVSELETRFMCMEAIMASIDEKLAGLTMTAAPSLSRSLSMKRMAANFSAGKTPEVKKV
ncbi:hypothetical protein EV178_001540 [Coemansia sp. RSA 1646]|nr:hypothetical protein EV178_001540 [Coemansia sp. RSA 1646]KAJ2090882.1 hypothetical protein IW138_002285 [Coemansia sp. RSA 986]